MRICVIRVLDKSMKQAVIDKTAAFFSRYPQISYKAGQILIFSGEKTNSIYFLEKGRIKITEINYRGDELILHMFHPPIFFPMGLIINDRSSPYIYQADSDITIRKAPADETHRFIQDNPDVMYLLLSRMYDGVDVLLDRIAQLMSGDAKSRVMFEIFTYCKYHGETTGNACRIDLREREIAARTGLSRETVSRVVKKLIEKNLLLRNNSEITIPDIQKFERYLSPHLMENMR